MAKKYYVIKTTKDGVTFKRTKTLDYWSKNKADCWQYSKQGATKIAQRYNKGIPNHMKYKVHYNILEVK